MKYKNNGLTIFKVSHAKTINQLKLYLAGLQLSRRLDKNGFKLFLPNYIQSISKIFNKDVLILLIDLYSIGN